MNAEDKGKITQNLTYLKERLGDLDPILDRLIEKNAFKFEHRTQIEGISKPTPHRQFNEFIKILVSSPKRDAYQVFIEALKEEGYGFVAQKLQKTPAKDGYGRYQSAGHGRLSRTQTYTPSFQVENSFANDDAGAASADAPQQAKDGCTDCASTVKTMLLAFGKQQETLLTRMEEQRREDISEIERRRQEDKKEQHDQLRKMWGQWDKEKQDIISSNDVKIQQLEVQINEFQSASHEFGFLKEKYDHLKEKQKGMREVDNDRRTRLMEMTQEREGLKKENQKLHEELHLVKTQLQQSKERNRILECQASSAKECIDTLDSEKNELENEISRKERENMELRSKVDRQYNDIQELLQKQRTESRPDDFEYTQTVEQQMKKLDAIYGMVQNISKEKVVEIKPRMDQRNKRHLKLNVTGALMNTKKFTS